MNISPNQKILAYNITPEQYNFQYLKDNWSKCITNYYCPACKSIDLKNHAQYIKYYYSKRIQILRLRCKACRRTHAVIPSFSLPGTSIGTAEAEQFIMKKEQGSSTYAAANAFKAKEIDISYPYKASTIFTKYFHRAKALFPSYGKVDLHGLAWIKSVVNQENDLLTAFNLFCLSHGVNAVFCNRASILLFKERKPGNKSSHNIPVSKADKKEINSS